jgi:two-component sensor histidine kinase
VTEAKEAERQRELLMSELDHRVKNMLASVHSIASRTLGSGPHADAFLARVHALAKAHGLLSRSKWEGAGMRDLADAILEPFGRRIDASGPDLQLDHGQTQALGMVLHELATNTAKYGALSVPGGHVELKWRVDLDGTRTLVVDWQERDGPAVARPERAGFGLSFLSRAVEAQLGGQADLAFLETGFRCRLRVPLQAGHAFRGRAVDEPARASPPDAAPALAGCRVLLVEDSVLIAMETEDVLEDAGCVVVGPVATLRDGLRLADRERLDAAVLDVDLAGEPVFPLAARLRELGVPFVFVTGYNERAVFPSEFADVPRIGKPIHGPSLLAALSDRSTPSRIARDPGAARA